LILLIYLIDYDITLLSTNMFFYASHYKSYVMTDNNHTTTQ